MNNCLFFQEILDQDLSGIDSEYRSVLNEYGNDTVALLQNITRVIQSLLIICNIYYVCIKYNTMLLQIFDLSVKYLKNFNH